MLWNRRRLFLGTVSLSMLCSSLAGCGGASDPGAVKPRSGFQTAPPCYAGREVCAECHEQQARAWQGSDHDLAMQVADEDTVLGDFGDAGFTYHGTTSTFFRRDGKFLVKTDGPDGRLGEYEVAYTFGVDPLQQYLIPMAGGRLQALGLAWDTRPAAAGGQRWFHLYPDEAIAAGDPLHWTSSLQNWNYQCAECHSTDLEKNYRPEENRYETSWEELDVSCEACHGPGSRHVEWARGRAGSSKQPNNAAAAELGLVVDLSDRDGGAWRFAESGVSTEERVTPEVTPEVTAQRTQPRASRQEIETCGRCHSRRSTLASSYRHGAPLADTHRIALLEENLYHADGQILEEVYEYGSFLQSRMYQAGVTCHDCHDPHTARLREAGNALCATCHAARNFDDARHHHHEPGSAGAQCAACHMPVRTYMVIDARRDHGFRIPRPELSLRIGTPNACNDCHAERSFPWAAQAVRGWYGPEEGRRPPHWGEAIWAGRHWQKGAAGRLARVAQEPEVPGIARATALTLLARFPSPGLMVVLEDGLEDPDPLVRMGALVALEPFDPPTRLEHAAPLLVDPVRSVRLEAVRLLASVPEELLSTEQRSAFEVAAADYRDAQLAIAERPEAHLNLALLSLRRSDQGGAEREYQRALELEPLFVPAYVNLADLYRAEGQDERGEPLLLRALELEPDSGDVHHALGLLRVRQGRHREALEPLARATELFPESPRYAFVYALALESQGQIGRALEVLERAHERAPAERDLVVALVTMSRTAGRSADALRWARELSEQWPEDPGAAELVRELEGAAPPVP